MSLHANPIVLLSRFHTLLAAMILENISLLLPRFRVLFSAISLLLHEQHGIRRTHRRTLLRLELEALEG